jgi:hypothetical protein
VNASPLPQLPTTYRAFFGFRPDTFHCLSAITSRTYSASMCTISGGSHGPAWHDLCTTLIALHDAAYHWPADRTRLMPALTARLQTLLHAPRATLKALVDELDQIQQVFFAQQQAGGRD